MPATAPLGRVKFIRDRLVLLAALQLTVDSVVVPAKQDVLVSPARFAVIASGIPTRTIPPLGMLFFGVKLTV